MMVSHRKFPESLCALMPSPRPSPTGRGGKVPSPLRERGRVRGRTPRRTYPICPFPRCFTRRFTSSCFPALNGRASGLPR
ncbi:hypothetical protein D5067_0020590 [Enterobacter huaxiensis]|nr:hypothetical protein D5067_0020590 [Enterobacter huaxiensis]